MYAYTSNNPVMRVDPSGYAWYHWAIAGAVVVGLGIAVVATAGGAALAIPAVVAAANGVASASMATTVLSFAFVGASGALATSALMTIGDDFGYHRGMLMVELTLILKLVIFMEHMEIIEIIVALAAAIGGISSGVADVVAQAKAGVSGVTNAAMSVYNGGDLNGIGKSFATGVVGSKMSPYIGNVTQKIFGPSKNPVTSQLIKIGGVRLASGIGRGSLHQASPFVEGLLSNLQ